MSRNRIIRGCGFTEKGKQLLDRIKRENEENFYKIRNDETLNEWIEEGFRLSQSFIFVGACGIAVRLIAPYVKDKQRDSAVLVVDEAGKFVIPILSGHLGGANELARELAELLGAQAVLTTATDVNGFFAVDDFARKNGLSLFPKDGIRKVSSKILENGRIRMRIEEGILFDKAQLPEEICLAGEEEPVDVEIVLSSGMGEKDTKVQSETDNSREDRETGASLTLTMKPYVVGMGCKKGTSFEALSSFLEEALTVPLSQVAAITSMDLKKKEEGLLTLAAANHLPFYTFSKEELLTVTGDEAHSGFVEAVTGVSNVCEKSALYYAGKGSKLVQTKTAGCGITLAVAKRLPRLEGLKDETMDENSKRKTDSQE